LDFEAGGGGGSVKRKKKRSANDEAANSGFETDVSEWHKKKLSGGRKKG